MITLTDAAAARVKELIGKADKPVLGLRVGVDSRGCSGLSYVVEYAEEQKRFEDIVEDKGVKIFIDPTAVMFLLGSEMGYGWPVWTRERTSPRATPVNESVT